MFNLLFTNFLDLQRHEQASFSEQRQAYLHKLHADGMGIRHLRGLAGLLIAIDELLALRESDTFEIPLEYIVQKTSEWDSMTRQQRCDMRVEDLCNGQHTSSNVAMTFMFNSASNDE